MQYCTTNVIIACIYEPPNMDNNEFNDDFLNKLLDKLSKEKTIFPLVDFNINLSNYDFHLPTMSSLTHFHLITFYPTCYNPQG